MTPIAPPTWNGAWVRERLREAVEVERRLPRPPMPVSGRSWLFATTYEFADVVGWPDARERIWSDWEKARGVYSYEIDRMDEALAWLALLREHPGELACLKVWSYTQTWSLRRALARRGLSRTTFYRRVREGSDRIAVTLHARGVKVR